VFLGYAAFVLASVFGIMTRMKGGSPEGSAAVEGMLTTASRPGSSSSPWARHGSVWAPRGLGPVLGWDPRRHGRSSPVHLHPGHPRAHPRQCVSARFMAILVVGLAAVRSPTSG
jgi:hypothetical protein